MDKKILSIATITWARDDKEEKLLRESLQNLAALEIPVFITDGGSRPEFLEFLQGFSNFNVFKAEAKGLWAQAKNSLVKAYESGSAFILYTEPDKYNYFKKLLPRMLDDITIEDDLGIVMASRSHAGFATFPAFQRMTETTINNCCAEVIGKTVDYTYGPFLLNRKFVPCLEQVKEDIGWGWRPYAFVIVSRMGYKIEAYVADFSCPPEQRVDHPSERIYRMHQLKQSIEGIVLSANVTLPDHI
jgi:hypothetical protein